MTIFSIVFWSFVDSSIHYCAHVEFWSVLAVFTDILARGDRLGAKNGHYNHTKGARQQKQYWHDFAPSLLHLPSMLQLDVLARGYFPWYL